MTRRTTTQTPIRPSRGARGTWKLRDYPGLLWLILAAIVAFVHPYVPESRWLMVHLVLLGAITHSIMVWSTHFTQTLLKVGPRVDDRRAQTVRLWLLFWGTVAVLVGIPTGLLPLTLVGASVVVAAVLTHAVQLRRTQRVALPNRFGVSVQYYIAASLCLPAGAVIGAVLAMAPSGDWHGRLLLAHSMINTLGWVGLTVAGTLLTLWPTMLRTRISPGAERRARQALPILLVALAVVVGGSLLGQTLISTGGLVLYAAGMAWWASAVLTPVFNKAPREFAPASVGLSLLWWLGAVIVVLVGLIRADSWAEFAADFGAVSVILVLGFVVQLLTGALSYLVPSVLGGGKTVVRAGGRWFDAWGTARLAAINVGLLIFLLPVPEGARLAAGAVAVLGAATFIPLMILGIQASVAAKREAALARERGETPLMVTGERGQAHAMPSIWSTRQLTLTLVILALVVGLGVAVSAGREPVHSTGQVTVVEVDAYSMYFEPSSVAVPTGNRLVIELTNRDPAMVHDLVINGHSTPRLAPGETATLDVGVITQSTQGWCAVVGHRQAGMVFDVIVDDQPMQEADHHVTSAQTPRIDPSATVEQVVDAALPPVSEQRVHRMTLTAQELELEVAPGITQLAWTFNGTVPGPTLRGRVGDRFELTLVNDGSLGHSIDFHAGALAPDEPMRTIAPGESLEYHFTAERAGIWMYHCGTTPMTAHIGAGMFGAVIIEPEEGLTPVGREYVMVQSEVFLEPGTGSEGVAPAPVDAAAAAADQPSFVVFNGIANQYTDAGRMLEATVGEKVRFWVLAAGPSRGTAFHIVGGQFDTMYLEGAYVLGPDAEAAGAQALGLHAAQGGFVELTFPEAGHYPVLNHAMVDAERGAMGMVRVTE